MKKGFLVASGAFIILASVLAIYALRVGWAEQTAFDIIGVLWLMQNLPILFAWAMVFIFAALAIYCLLIGIGVVESRLGRLGKKSEQERMMSDPRFWSVPPGN